MQINSIEFDDNRQPEIITVKLTLNEALLIANYVGSLSGASSPNNEASESIYDELAGMVFNPYWEDGIEGAARGERS